MLAFSFPYIDSLFRRSYFRDLMFHLAFVLLIAIASYSAAADTNYVSIIGKDDNETLLEQKDLKLEIEGKEVPIKEFFFVDTLHPKQKTLFHPAGRRQHIILLDLVFSKPDDIVKARAWMEDLASKASPYDLFALAGITQTNGLRWFCNLTSDRNQLRAGWNAITKEKPSGVVPGPEGNFYPATFQESAPVKLSSEDVFRKNLDGVLVKSATDQDRYIVLQCLVDNAYLLATVEGRKNVYLVSPGFDSKGLSINLELNKRKRPTDAGRTAGGSEVQTFDEVTNSFRSTEELEQMATSRPRPRQQAGVEVLPDLYSGADAHIHVLSASTERNGLLENLTSKTAGFYHLGNFDSAQVLNTDRFYYVAGWEEVETEKALCSVHLSAQDRKIEASEKWLAPKYFEEYSNEEKRATISEAIFKDYGKPEPSQHFWADFYFEGGLNKIPMFTQISGDYLLKIKTDTRKLEVYNFVIDSDQSIVDFQSSVIEMDLSNKKLRERIEKTGLKVWHILLGSTKPMQIRWVILDGETGEIFTHSEVLDVQETQLTMSNPFVPATNLQWVVWPKPTDQIKHRGIQIQYPYNTKEGIFIPDLAPQFKTADKDHILYFKLYNLLPESTNPPVQFHLMDAKGNASAVSEFQLLRKPEMIEHQGIELFWVVKSLPNVQPGAYRFRVDIQEPAGKGGITAETSPLQVSGL
jgi:hypothetical protein